MIVTTLCRRDSPAGTQNARARPNRTVPAGPGADTLDLPAERRRLTSPALNRRHPILLTLLAQSAVDVLDSVVQLFDQPLSGSESRARITLRDPLAERAKLSEDRLTLLDEILPVLADTGVPDEELLALREHGPRQRPRRECP
ncbi:hypothetical protein OG930_38925 [Streptomyces sp. NBC_01799]|uniref:hypothetical protein n=1 Tax=Streptomyces sp. NBC_01800 TaxID=2975945 RepID=UPI002DD91FAB|nr:hypothetical protein [Streptomyces sp. NBC_01800]WSA72523.1 hypothetical protein OIE65_39540 [Streptomyces sp. NBC_01800]WSA81048.1 hypothetical protein OG930_38925 [Streptomyces sp. NBC_01799]